MELVSIIIPVYNGANSLGKCIESCIHQTYKEIEIIVVNDGSKDNSLEIAESYAAKDERIKILSKENEGLPLTRRRGFELSGGSYIYHLDSDDYIEHQTIELLLRALKAESADIVIGASIYEDKTGREITDWISRAAQQDSIDYIKRILRNDIQPNIWGRLIRREVFEEVHVPRQYNCGEDYLANFLMITGNDSLKIVSIEDKLYHYLVYNESLTNTWPAEEFIPFTVELEKLFSASGIEEQIMPEWAIFRIKKIWLPYLRRGGKVFLQNRPFVKDLYRKYLKYIRKELSFFEKLELRLYPVHPFLGKTVTRIRKVVSTDN